MIQLTVHSVGDLLEQVFENGQKTGDMWTKGVNILSVTSDYLTH